MLLDIFYNKITAEIAKIITRIFFHLFLQSVENP